MRVIRAFPNAWFEQPTALVASPDHAWWYVAERRGRVWRIAAADESAMPDLVLDLSDRVDASSAAIGVLALAIDPAFDTRGAIFVSYTAAGGTVVTSRISRFYSHDGGRSFDRSAEQRLLELDQIADEHVNTDMQFGPDGYLYVGFGDGGPQGDPLGRAQDPYSLKGKILRVDVAGERSYKIPPDNPLARGDGRPEVWALGLRNPWRFAFDRETGELWAGDVGGDQVDEIDRITRGGNYGWNVREGDRCASPSTCRTAGLIDPVAALVHPEVSSITFGVAYRGAALPALRGHLIYGDYASGVLWELDPNDRRPHVLNSDGHPVVAFAEDSAGEPMLVDLRGTLWRVVPGTPGPSDVPTTLSDTGCFGRGGSPSPGLIPYEINTPFWSDGAAKRRWLAIPDGTKIHVDDVGHLQLPIGSVVVKEFSFGDLRVETRLLVRHDDGEWAGYTYRWDAGQVDATLIASGPTGTASAWPRPWYYPHRGECLRCHQAAAGYTLGLELAQLSREIEVDGRSVDQLAQFRNIGLFDNEVLSTSPLPSDGGTVEQRARAWLHVNCAYCHRPGASGQGDIDLRYTTPVTATGLCDAARDGTFGFPVTRRVVPGDPVHSMLSRRIHATGFIRMPPLGTYGIDTRGVAVVDDWIRSLTCTRR